MSPIINASILCVLLTAASAAFAQPPTTGPVAPLQFQSNGVYLLQARQRFVAGDPDTVAVVKKLCNRADDMLKDGPYTVTHKMHPLPGIDPHDYVSLAPYYWPDPTTPNGLPYIRKDGLRNPEIHEYDAKPFGDMSDHVWTLALAGYLSGDAKYSDRSAQLIRVWFFDPATRMNPNLNHGQLVKGTNMGRGTGIIETARLFGVVDAVELLRLSTSWTKADQESITAWFRDYVNWMATSTNGKAESNAGNNHGVWYDAQIVTYMLFLNDTADAKKIVAAAPNKRIAAQIQPDGEMPRELARTNAFSYSCFNVTAFSLLADLGKRVNVDLWNFKTKDGRSIPAAINWLVPYATGQEKWKHQQISGSMSATGLFVPLRRASYEFHDPMYEQIIAKLKGDSRGDNLRFPPPGKTPIADIPEEKPGDEDASPVGD